MCAQNAICLGARTHLSLCPPGPNRRTLAVALSRRTESALNQLQNMTTTTTIVQTTDSSTSNNHNSNNNIDTTTRASALGRGLELLVGPDRLEEYIVQEEEYLLRQSRKAAEFSSAINNHNESHELSNDEEDEDDDNDELDDGGSSSGDDDPLIPVETMFSEEPWSLDDEALYTNVNIIEALYIPINASNNNNNLDAHPSKTNRHHHHNNNNNNTKLPFNRRKIRFWDRVTATETKVARRYLQTTVRQSQQRAALARFSQQQHKHPSRWQQPLRRNLQSAATATTTTTWSTALNQQQFLGDDSANSDVFSSSSMMHPAHFLLSDVDPNTKNKSTVEDVASGSGGSNAVWLEQQKNNSFPIFEPRMTPAMAAALLIQSLSIHPYESMEGMAACYNGIVAAGVALLDTPDPTQLVQTRPTRTAIMDALAPLLVTTLEEPSGQVILILAKLRRWCGTLRYRRRFVQRIAPAWIRPPGGAMWCLRHQNDMVAILAAAELILDAAFVVFSPGWYDRGRWMLADSQRAETLTAAATQLRNLSHEPAPDSLTFGQVPMSSGGRRPSHRILPKGLDHHLVSGVGGTALDEPLAEWEVIAVDRYIRRSVANVLETDWTRASFPEMVPPKPLRLRSTSTGGTNNTSTNALNSATPIVTRRLSVPSPQISGVADMSPFGGVAVTPHSPRGVSPVLFGKHMVPSSSAAGPPLGGNEGNSSTLSVALSNYDPTIFGPPFGVDRIMSPPPGPFLEMDTSPTLLQQQQHYAVLSPPKSPKSPTRNIGELSPKRISKDSSGTVSSFGLTPLSPSTSPIGSFETTAAHRANSSSPVASVGPTAHYRMLTSTAAERKRTVAACRALRAQIQRFEDAFIQLHGRPPKGVSDRAPLATTYAQYREWKRAIRADAACRIEALFRGSSTRWALLRLNDNALTRVIRSRAGRADAAESLLTKISLPSEIGQPDSSDSGSFRPTPLMPQWSKSNVGSSSEALSLPGAPRPFQELPSLSPSNVPPDTSKMSFAELQACKRDLKQQLKQYDMNFVRRHGRMPVKSEKEPIRNLYECYNSLKTQITELERGGQHLPSASTAAVSLPVQPVLHRTVSPPSGSEGSDESIGAKMSPLLISRVKRKLPKPSSTTPPIGGTVAGDLAALKLEKGNLHKMLRSFEKDFFRENRRQVSSFADIRPVASQYRRYKEIKKAIAALQQGES